MKKECICFLGNCNGYDYLVTASCRPIRSEIIFVIKQIGLPLLGGPILLTTRMITDRIGLHSVLLPLKIASVEIKLAFFYQVIGS